MDWRVSSSFSTVLCVCAARFELTISCSAGKTVNLKLQSSDNVTLGAWFVFSDPFYRKAVYPPPPRTTAQDKSLQLELIPTAIAHRPTILFLHGNTGTRAHHLRTVLYTAFTSRLDANVLAVDYRGFGDSQGYPTVQGVGWDARAAWNFLIDQGAKPENVLIVGHSLGTAIAGLLASQLGAEGIHPRGTVLMSVCDFPEFIPTQLKLYAAVLLCA